jgi:hypothetical protein
MAQVGPLQEHITMAGVIFFMSIVNNTFYASIKLHEAS